MADEKVERLSAFHAVGEESLQAVRRIFEDGCLTRLLLDFGPLALLIDAEEDDSIDFSTVKATDVAGRGTDASLEEPWVHFIGKPFGWGWVTINQQGYTDGVLLSFDEVVFPEIVVNVVASELKVGRVARVSQAGGAKGP